MNNKGEFSPTTIKNRVDESLQNEGGQSDRAIFDYRGTDVKSGDVEVAVDVMWRRSARAQERLKSVEVVGDDFHVASTNDDRSLRPCTPSVPSVLTTAQSSSSNHASKHRSDAEGKE